MMEPTATHLPALEMVFDAHQIKTVLEFGCGKYSTKFFNDRGCQVTSIEMQNESWFDRMRAELPHADIRLCLGAMEWQNLDLLPRYDFIFVDGHKDSRPECMVWAKERADIIAAHDTEHPVYGWERADMSGYTAVLYGLLKPTTTIWRKNKWQSLDGVGEWLV